MAVKKRVFLIRISCRLHVSLINQICLPKQTQARGGNTCGFVLLWGNSATPIALMFDELVMFGMMSTWCIIYMQQETIKAR